MHEYSIVQALFSEIEQEVERRGATAVRRVQVILGELSGVEPELFRTAYETFRERTICDGAVLELAVSPAAWGCSRCGRLLARGQPLRCPDCRLPATLTAGDEILLQSIEMEVGDV
jgi:hydrogenase nickel incorporation protein HypA/HybF